MAHRARLRGEASAYCASPPGRNSWYGGRSNPLERLSLRVLSGGKGGDRCDYEEALSIVHNVASEQGTGVRWLKWIGALLAFGFVSFVASMEVTDYLEEDNRFCISCHLHEQIFENFMTDTPQLVT